MTCIACAFAVSIQEGKPAPGSKESAIMYNKTIYVTHYGTKICSFIICM